MGVWSWSAARRALVCGLLALSLAGCVTVPRVAFTEAERVGASPPGFAGVRYDENAPALIEGLRRDVRPGVDRTINVLALSGGGANGAYGAGVIYGWRRSGDRPQLQIVTGVSIGALIAPFAYLGSAWDERLKAAFADPLASGLLKSRGVMAVGTPGFFSKASLTALVDTYVDDAMVRAIAAEQARGRRLLVATTDLDSERLIVWDMGAIAARGGPAARKLFSEVLVASASLPGMFAPSMIEVESGGHRFAEMHVDGQTVSAFFAIPQTLLLTGDPVTARGRVRMFILINGNLDSRFELTRNSSIPIVVRALDASQKASIRSALIATASFCRRNGLPLRISQLPELAEDDPLDFHKARLRSLFDEGAAAAAAGTAWQSPEQLPAILGLGEP